MVTAGLYDVVLALGVEKLSHPDKAKSFAAFAGAMDIDELKEMIESLAQAAKEAGGGEAGAGQSRSMFMDVYASAARAHMEKLRHHGGAVRHGRGEELLPRQPEPRAQFQQELSVEEVLAERMIVEPLTRAMCSPIGDGAAAAVIVSERKARELGIAKPVRVDDERDALGLQPRRGRARHRAALRARRLRGGRAWARRTST